MRRWNRIIDDRDRLMNRWRQSASSELSHILGEIAKQLENYEQYFGLRKRKRKAADKRTFMACVEALVCDLVHRALTSEHMKGRIAVSLNNAGKRSRYNAPCDSKQFPVVVALMAKPEMGFLEVCEPGGWMIGKRTAVRAGQRLLNWMHDWNISLWDLCLNGDEEIVIQKSGKHDPLNEIDGRGEWIEYKDNAITRQYRAEVRAINEWLYRAELGYTGGRLVDLTDKRLRRYFNNRSFKEGGRLFGGFWQHLKARQAKLITIDGAAVADVDYSAMQVAIARAAVGAEHDIWRDAYLIPGFEQHRQGIKKVLASMLFAQAPLKRWPKETQCLFPLGTSILQVTEAIQKALPELSGFWYTGAGYGLMFRESEILIDVLLRLKAAGVVALPKHDCVIVPEAKALTAARIMQEAFAEHTGGTVSVTVSGKKLLSAA